MNIIRYLRTISYLKPHQIYYQIKYRIFGYKKSKINGCFEYNAHFNIAIPILDEDKKYINRFQPNNILNNKIELIHEIVNWKPAKWNYSDKSHLWNFNLHYFEYGIALATKYKETKDERFYQKLVELYNDWHKTCFNNKKSDAWHPYTISLRLKNLIIIGGIICNREWFELVSCDIYEQYKFLINNQEKNLLGNHYFENLVTIYLCSNFFGEKKIQQKYERILIYEMKEQILPDGMHYERSFMYHNLILEDLIRMWLVCSEGIFRIILQDNIKKMTDCIYSFEQEERIPSFNDTGSNVSKRKMQLINTVENLIGYLPRNRQLENAGYYKLDNDNFSLIIDVGELAPKYITGHGQCDALSFELFYKDYPILVNSGTYHYQTDKRAYFRGTVSHNTLQAVGVEQSECWGEHRTAGRINVICVEKTDKAIKCSIKDFKNNLLRREVVLEDKILVRDYCSKLFNNYWHIHPLNNVKQVSEKEIHITVMNGDIICIKANNPFEKMSGWYSEEFGKMQENVAFQSDADSIEIYIN